MQLTKEQIQQIDNILKEKGIKFWDVRLEMIDHIANDIEESSNNTECFSKTINSTLEKLGFNENLNSLINEKQKKIKKEFRNKTVKELISFFTNWRTLSFYVLYLLIGINQINNKTFFISSMIIIFAFAVIQVVFSLVKHHKVYKSIHLLNAMINITAVTSLLVLFLNIPRLINENYKFTNEYILFVCLFISPLTYASIKVFIDTYKKYDFTALKN